MVDSGRRGKRRKEEEGLSKKSSKGSRDDSEKSGFCFFFCFFFWLIVGINISCLFFVAITYDCRSIFQQLIMFLFVDC